MKYLAQFFLILLSAVFWSTSFATELPLVVLKVPELGLQLGSISSPGINKRVMVSWPDEDASFFLCSNEPLVYSTWGDVSLQVSELDDKYLYKVTPAGHLIDHSGKNYLAVENLSAIDLSCSSVSRNGIPHALNQYTDSFVNSTTVQLELCGTRHELDAEGRYQVIVNEATLWSVCCGCWRPSTTGDANPYDSRTRSPELKFNKEIERKGNDGDENNPPPSNSGNGEEDAAPDGPLLSQMLVILNDPTQLSFMSQALAFEYTIQPAFLGTFISSQSVGLTLSDGIYGSATWQHLLQQIQQHTDKKKLLKALLSYLGMVDQQRFQRAINRVRTAVELINPENQPDIIAAAIVEQLEAVSSEVSWFWNAHTELPGGAMEHTQQNWGTLIEGFMNHHSLAITFLCEVEEAEVERILNTLRSNE